ncbi:hypothetical protein ACFQ0M_27480 [Kitasatospora aburaviensis]
MAAAAGGTVPGAGGGVAPACSFARARAFRPRSLVGASPAAGCCAGASSGELRCSGTGETGRPDPSEKSIST